ncbi:hypothetical protein [Plebeiibacterium sediminum]|uniref:6-bladed beta-propeller n=1 Tax=Plebeiibacterium sediminum TaxID=2992112 RepID=A0AAE3M4D1_9BACT|nr:hypothetical protein [Plebeiobacterium sediminum]MCW3786612.1 hypothetical protein [Plebeiobacterium sediminum]
MQQRIIYTAILLFFIQLTNAQSLVDIYKKGTVKLIPDTEYANNNDWNEVFKTYYDTIYNKPMGDRKSIIMMPNGSLIINHAYRNFYSKFDVNGNFIEEFGITDSSGKRFKKANNIVGVINNNFFTGLDNMGVMQCMDFDGHYKKKLVLDYMTRDMIPVSDHKIAVVGWVIWKTKFRDFVAIVDYNTNEQKVIWEKFTDRCESNNHCDLFNYRYTFKKGGSFSMNTMPFTKNIGMSSPPKIACVNNQIIVAIPTTGEIFTYSIDGKLLNSDKITWATNYISVEEQKEIQQKAIDKCLNTHLVPWISEEEGKIARETLLNMMKEDLSKIKDPIPIPVFSHIIKDSDENLLFFEIPKEEGMNKFNVWIYKNDGKFVCQSSFQCDDYELNINPSKMVFYKGYIYALQKLKNTNGNPLRLVRFKIAGN